MRRSPHGWIMVTLVSRYLEKTPFRQNSKLRNYFEEIGEHKLMLVNRGVSGRSCLVGKRVVYENKKCFRMELFRDERVGVR